MTRGLMTSGLLGVTLVAAGMVPSSDNGPGWLTDFAQARQAARAAGKPIFLVFRCER